MAWYTYNALISTCKTASNQDGRCRSSKLCFGRKSEVFYFPLLVIWSLPENNYFRFWLKVPVTDNALISACEKGKHPPRALEE